MCLGVPMKILELHDDGFAIAESGSVNLKISTKLLEKVNLGDYVIIHAGFAIEILDEKAAMETFALLKELAKSHEEVESEQLE
jgi:hydrogenase expression/formation protein HypC